MKQVDRKHSCFPVSTVLVAIPGGARLLGTEVAFLTSPDCTTIHYFLRAPRRFCRAAFRITLSVSEGTVSPEPRPLADAQGYPLP
jgi:hypothetical protein